MRKLYILVFVLLCVAFYIFVGLPPTSSNQRPAYLRLDRENTESNVVTWVGRAPRYEVSSFKVNQLLGARIFHGEDFYIVSEARFVEEDLYEGLMYYYRVRGLDVDGEPISKWSRGVRRTLPIRGVRPDVFLLTPQPPPEGW